MNEQHSGVQRVRHALVSGGHRDDIRWLSDSARTAVAAAAALGIDVGQIASSLVFSQDSGDGIDDESLPVLVITSGQHRVDTHRVAASIGIPALGRVDADFVRRWSGFAIGGVAPVGWQPESPEIDQAALARFLTVIIDEALGQYDDIWAAAGHPHTVFPTSLSELQRMTNGRVMRVGD